MKILTLILKVLLFATFFSPSLSCAWLNDVFLIKGKIKSFDQITVRIQDSFEQIVVVPREAIPKNFKLASGANGPIPVYTQYVLQVKSGRTPAGKKIQDPTASFDKMVKLLKLDYQKTVNSR